MSSNVWYCPNCRFGPLNPHIDASCPQCEWYPGRGYRRSAHAGASAHEHRSHRNRHNHRNHRSREHVLMNQAREHRGSADNFVLFSAQSTFPQDTERSNLVQVIPHPPSTKPAAPRVPESIYFFG